MKETVVMYAALCEGDDAEIVHCPFFRRVIPASLPCHVQYPAAIESPLMASECGVCVYISCTQGSV